MNSSTEEITLCLENLLGRVRTVLPPTLLLVPPTKRKASDYESWKVYPVNDEKLTKFLNNNENSESYIFNIFNFRFLEKNCQKNNQILSRISSYPMSLVEFVRGIIEITIYDLSKDREFSSSLISRSYLIRRISEIITNEKEIRTENKIHNKSIDYKDNRYIYLREAYLDDVCIKSIIKYIFNRVLAKNIPILITEITEKETSYIELKNRKLLYFDIEFIFRSIYRHKRVLLNENPIISIAKIVIAFHEMVEYERNNNKSSEITKDSIFIEYIKNRDGIIKGKGLYINYSTRFVEIDGEKCIRLSYTVPPKKILQQVSNEEIFILWDLEKYPIEIYVNIQIDMEANLEVDRLNYTPLFTECPHRSIRWHRFVNGFEDESNSGIICTEYTRDRIVNLHQEHFDFDPVKCFLEQLRSAGRLLIYGVRSRDHTITPHHHFKDVPLWAWQKVIHGWAAANSFAKEHGAEIVTYDR